jgi:hypothetical protein
MFPSEIFFSESPHDDLLKHEVPLKHAVPPFAELRRQDHNWQARVVSEFKWRAPSQNVTATEATKAYLRMILHLVLAELYAGGTSTVELVATYPLAFRSNQVDDYMNLLRELCRKVALDTGLHVQTPKFVSESVAGIHCHRQDHGLSMVVDLGGGTTDITVMAGTESPWWVESIHYGGNRLVKVLARPSLIELFPQNLVQGLDSSGPDQDQARFIALQQYLRNKDLYEVTQQLGANGRGVVRLLAGKFFDGLCAFLALLLAGYLREEGHGEKLQVGLFLIGNGWKFLHFASDEPGQYVERLTSSHLERMRQSFDPETQWASTTLVAHGIAKGPTAMKEQVASGALQSPEVGASPSGSGKKTLTGFPVDEVTAGGRIVHAWFSKVPLAFKNAESDLAPKVRVGNVGGIIPWELDGTQKARLNFEIQRKVEADPPRQFRLLSSVLATYLEEVYLESIVDAHPGGR